MPSRKSVSVVIGCLLLLMPGAADAAEDQVSFHKDIKPILSQHCYGCHQGAKQQGGYDMTAFASLKNGGETGNTAIVSGKADESYLIEQITVRDGHAEMPSEPFAPLPGGDVELIRRWVAAGAIDDSPPETGPKYDPQHPPAYAAAPTLPSIDVSPDGTQLALAGYHEVLLIDAATGETKTRLVGMSPRINTVRFSPNGQRLAAVGGTPAVRGEVQVWNTGSSELELSLPVSFDALAGVSWSPDGATLAFGASDNVIRGIDSVTGDQKLFQGAHDDWVRDTAFTHDGTHLVSVARDMSCKLTEVATERFVDNVTSITPGALSGGLSSVVAHPSRNEIVIGGADGIAKVYRVFRETQRRIGDDANLVRTMPRMTGRIFSVDISPSGDRLAAAATIDGDSEIRVWKYNFDGTLSKELKDILAKRVSDRSAEEKTKVEGYRNHAVTEVIRHDLADVVVYAVAFGPDGELFASGDDGKVRRLDADGSVAVVFDTSELIGYRETASATFDPTTWGDTPVAETEDRQPVSADDVVAMTVHPLSIETTTPYEYAQLIVTGELRDGSSVDLTRQAEWRVPEFVVADGRGMIRPTADGNDEVRVRFGSHEVSVGIVATGVDLPDDETDIGHVDYIRDVSPIMSRLGCNQGTCHGAQKGKNGFRLSLRGYDAKFDLRALTDDLAARRINPAAPEESLMLRKPLGTTPHQGGALMVAGDPYHEILRRWIADGSKLDLTSPRVQRIDVFPNNPIVQSTTARQQIRVVAHFADQTSRDVTREAFVESGNTEVATAERGGLVSAVRRGEAPILVRYEGAYAATTLTVMGDRSGYVASGTPTWDPIDQYVVDKWQRVKVVPSGLCDDATFLRRVTLDLTGLPPTSDEVRAFLGDDSPTRLKRARVVDALIGSEPYVDYWTNKWADLLQVNRKFLGVEGSEAFRDWIRESVATNKPYDQLAREVLTATGSNRENPPASYYKVLRTPEDTMENTTHLFMGVRFNCNKCHDHPFERWTQDQYYELASYFARVDRKRDPKSGDRKIGGTAVEGATPLFEIVVDSADGDVVHPTTSKPVSPAFPFKIESHDTDEGTTRREKLASWMTDPSNPYFARSYVNRLWGYLMGVGLIEPIDDIRAGNPPTNPELLDHLTNAFVSSDFDVQHVLRMICNSRSYQLDVSTNDLNADDHLNYSHALPRRLPAEVIYDSVHALTGAVSRIPGVAAGTRAAALADSGIKLEDGFLQNLGKPVRESACECERSSELQLGPVMALISGPTIGTAIADPKNDLKRLTERLVTDDRLTEEIFLRALGRRPEESELKAFGLAKQMIRENHQQLLGTLATKENDWKVQRVSLEASREEELAKTTQQIADHTAAIQPERDRLAKEREDRIAVAETKYSDLQDKLATKANEWAAEQKDRIDWHPLLASRLASTNKAVLTPQADRSIRAGGDAGKGIYTLTFETDLPVITGLRLEAIASPDLPSQGPGLGSNGNFVVTEMKVTAATKSNAKKSKPVKIASGTADYTQASYPVEKLFDGRERDQGGWAVGGATGVVHWATLKLAEPIENKEGTVLTIQLHQFHNAGDHRLGQFRVSATTASGDIPLGLPESLAAVVATPAKHRGKAENDVLARYVGATDANIRAAKDQLAKAKQPLKPDATLVSLKARKAKLSKPTSDPPALVRLREDAAQSKQQLRDIRLTAAEDLVWALVNSPAFLFNH